MELFVVSATLWAGFTGAGCKAKCPSGQTLVNGECCREVGEFYPDSDEDGHGDAEGEPVAACSGYEIEERVEDDHSDCNDRNEDIHPDMEEDCDGIDNDCDGEADEGLEGHLRNAFGVCNNAPELCRDGQWVSPNYELIEAFEAHETRCDGLDNDCDGEVDENPPLADQQLGICALTTKVCAADAMLLEEVPWGEPDYEMEVEGYEQEEQACDGLDNDCDGRTDENPPLADNQQGVCAGMVQVCVLEGLPQGEDPGWKEPDYAQIARYESPEESCDALDNDCDGSVDNGLSAPPNPLQDGVCMGSVQACGGALGWQAQYIHPDFEDIEGRCDGVDNDCDGVVDGCDECGCNYCDPDQNQCVECIRNDDCNQAAGFVETCVDSQCVVSCQSSAQCDPNQLCADAGNFQSHCQEITTQYLKGVSPPKANEKYGRAIAIDGDRAIVGAPGEDGEAGAAYVYEKDAAGQWQLMQRLTANPAQQNAEFGAAVGIHRDYLIVGAYAENNATGAAYIFRRQGPGDWVQEARVTMTTPSNNSSFGIAVSIHGDRALVGAALETADNTGAAYVFTRQVDAGGNGSWMEEERLTSNDSAARDRFGFPVVLKGNRAFIGAHQKDRAGQDQAGAAYVFEFDVMNGWGQVAKLEAPGAFAANDYFGVSIAAEGDRVWVGAMAHDENVQDSGAVFEFERQAGPGHVWQHTETIQADLPEQNAQFGSWLDVEGTRLLVGADFGVHANHEGEAFLFEEQAGSWVQTQQFLMNPAQAGNRAGRTVALSGNDVWIGAYQQQVGDALNAGAVFTFSREADAQGQQVWAGPSLLLREKTERDGDFGNDIDIDGNRMIVGAPYQSIQGVGSGAAYIFEKRADGVWKQQAVLVPDVGGDSYHFGVDVAIDGDRVLVGATGESATENNAGAAYIFERQMDGSWVQVDIIFAETRYWNDRFGTAVDLDGDRALVGAYQKRQSNGGTHIGAAYIFDRNPATGRWDRTIRFIPRAGAGGTVHFGLNVDLQGDRAIVGSRRHDSIAPAVSQEESGVAYIYDFDGMDWSETTVLEMPNPNPSDFFGQSVALNGDRAFVGAPYRDTQMLNNSGAVYVFDLIDGAWEYVQPIVPIQTVDGEKFGSSISFEGNRVLIGAAANDARGHEAGAAYLFELQPEGFWRQMSYLDAPNAGVGDIFGRRVILEGNQVVIASSQEDGDLSSTLVNSNQNSPDSGAVYVFDLGP